MANNGLYQLEEVKEFNVPVYDFTLQADEEPWVPLDFWTYSDLKRVFKWELDDDQRKNMIRGFIKQSRMKGYAPLYSLGDVMYLFLGYRYTYIPLDKE